MSSVPVGRYLRDISSDQGRQAGIPLVDYITMPDHHGRQSDMDAKIEEAHIQGVLEGRAEAQAEYDKRLAQKTADFERAFSEERAAWAEAEAGRLHSALIAELTRSHEEIAAQVAQVLQPFIASRAREKAIEELKRLLDQIMFKGEFRKITVEGPQDLLASFKAHVGEDIGGITFAVGDKADLRISADETILEARISEWIEAIRGEQE